MGTNENEEPPQAAAEIRAAIAQVEAQMEHITSSWMTRIDDPAVQRYEALARRLRDLHAALATALRPEA